LTRLFTIVVAVLVALVVAGGLLWYMAYGIDLRPPREVTIDSLEAPAEVGWREDGLVTISAESEHDRYAALGYVHGRARPWPMMLWRQAALGRLGEWFGPSALEVDSLSRKLGFAALAQRTYDGLSAEQKASLRAYTSGLNAALDGPAPQLDQEITLLDVQPASWKPWHTLALERLFAWLSAAPPPADSLRNAGPQVRAFFRADRDLRKLLHLHNFQQSAAWAVRDSAGTRLHRRLVHGASALPVFQEVAFQQPDSTYRMGASVPGMPFLWAGQSPDRAWTILPQSQIQVERGAWPDTSGRPVSYERLAAGDSIEHLLRIRRRGGVLPLGRATRSPPAFADTAQTDTLSGGRRGWLVRWPGLETGTDLAAWQALAEGAGGSFRLQRGDGLALSSDGSWQVLGSPNERVSLSDGGLVAGNTPWVRPLARSLDTLARRAEREDQTALPQPRLADTPPAPFPLTEECFSAWAARNAPRLAASLDSVRRRFSNRVQSASSYLRNWNYAYQSSSIAASIYDRWAAAYRDSTGQLPGALLNPDTTRQLQVSRPVTTAPVTAATDTASSDTLSRAATRPDTSTASYRRHVRRYRILARVVDSLTAEFGSDLSQWRLERTNPDRRLFPVWSVDSLGGKHSGFIGGTRYAPLELAGRGHPSSPCWGASPLQRGLPAPAAWQGVTRTSDWRALRVQKQTHALSRFMGRYLISDRPKSPAPLRPFAAPKRTTTLSPPSQPDRPAS
jgi:hypothetical protein